MNEQLIGSGPDFLEDHQFFKFSNDLKLNLTYVIMVPNPKQYWVCTSG